MGRMARRALGFVATVSLVGSGACGPDLWLTAPEAQLERNESRWASRRPLSYRYGLRRSCFCPPDAIGPVRVRVHGETVVERIYIDSGDPVSSTFETSFPTVEGLFDLIRTALEQDAYRVDVTYHADLGVPLDISIDYIENAVDDELAIALVELPVPDTD